MLPEILLDDVRFQELVSEARTRIVRHAPEWTEHNVSDPGITLIELYAWLTELLVYRINRIPSGCISGCSPCRRRAPAAGLRQRPGAVHARSARRWRGGPGGHRDRLATHGGQRVRRLSDGHRGGSAPRVQARHLRDRRKGADPAGRAAGVRGQIIAAPFGGPPRPATRSCSASRRRSRAWSSSCRSSRRARRGRLTRAIRRWRGRPPWAADEWEPVTVVADETGGFMLGGGAISVQCPRRRPKPHRRGSIAIGCAAGTHRGHSDNGAFAASPEITSVQALVAGSDR